MHTCDAQLPQRPRLETARFRPAREIRERLFQVKAGTWMESGGRALAWQMQAQCSLQHRQRSKEPVALQVGRTPSGSPGSA